MNHPTVYLDLTFLNNFIMDYIILWATSRLSGLKPHHARIAVASLMGAAYAVGYLCFQGSALFSLTGKIVVSVILVTLAIKPARWQDYSKILLYFYLINFTVAGATIALSSLLAGTGSVQFFRNMDSGSSAGRFGHWDVCRALYQSIYCLVCEIR